MKKVLHVVDAFLARSEVFVYTYVTAHKMYEASVLCNRRENELEFPFPRVHVVPDARTRLDAKWWASRALEHLSGESIWSRSARRVVEQLEPDVIHAHFGPTGCLMLPLAQALGIPLVTSFYGTDVCVLPKQTQWRAKYDALFSAGHLFLAEAREMQKKLVAAGAPADRTEIQRIAIPAHAYPAWEPTRGAPRVLFVGRLVEKKGLVDAIKAVARARRSVPELTMRVIGEGPEMERARAAVRAEQMTSAVTFLGTQPHGFVIEELRRTHALIHPSIEAEDGDSEGGAPTILLEAQAIGTPIVSTLHADIPNIVGSSPSIRLCREGDIAALAAALEGVLDHQQPVDPRFVRAHHDVAREIDALESKYARTIELAPAI